ncbi:MAG: LamG-like jellyroll fold domain-containing protein, partial [Bacteroidota bacterium]
MNSRISSHAFSGRVMFILLISLLFTNLIPAQICNGLVAHYPFDRSFEDISGNDNHGLADHSNLPSFVEDRFGNPKSAIRFDGTDDYLRYENNNQLHPSFPMTVAAWVKRADNGRFHIFRNDFRENRYDGIAFQVTGSGTIAITVGDGGLLGPGSRKSAIGTTQLNQTHWYHVTAVLHNLNQFELYVNGVNENASMDPNGTGSALTYHGGQGASGVSDNSSVANSPLQYSAGTLDDLRLYDRALSAAEVNTLAEREAINLIGATADSLRFMYPASFAGPQYLCGNVLQNEMIEVGLMVNNSIPYGTNNQVRGKLTDPSGNIRYINPFFYEPFDIELIGVSDPPPLKKDDTNIPFYYLDSEPTTAGGTTANDGEAIHVSFATEYEYRFRFSLPEIGNWTFLVEENFGGTWSAVGNTTPIPCIASSILGRPAFSSSINSQYLSYPNGETFFPIGESLSYYGLDDGDYWGGNRNPIVYTGQPDDYLVSHVFQYERWLKELAENNGNLVRIIFAAWTFDLEWETAGNYDAYMNRAADFDRIMRFCEDNGIYVQLSVYDHTSFEGENPVLGYDWDDHPYNSIPGVVDQEDVFSNTQAKEYAKSKLQYIISRWSYSPNLLALELQSEIDHNIDMQLNNEGVYGNVSDNFTSDQKDWVEEMADFVDQQDPSLLITVGTGDSHTDSDAFWTHSTIDFTNHHKYGSHWGIQYTLLDKSETFHNKYNKPHQIGELGIQALTDFCDKLPRDGFFTQTHNSYWATALSGDFMP